jgi:hypothetical protein
LYKKLFAIIVPSKNPVEVTKIIKNKCHWHDVHTFLHQIGTAIRQSVILQCIWCMLLEPLFFNLLNNVAHVCAQVLLILSTILCNRSVASVFAAMRRYWQEDGTGLQLLAQQLRFGLDLESLPVFAAARFFVSHY